MLSNKEKQTIKERIVDQIKKVESDIRELEELIKPVAPENAIGRVSRMDAINNKSVNEAALRQSIQRLLKLKYALQIIDTSMFGTCTRCGALIPYGRLKSMPESTKCQKCAR
ncbi:TraR/DksA family transcriptional regulator [Sphingobacterium multivorum]